MRRPSSEGAAGSWTSWSSGAYSYDGAGNITRIGTATYTYDGVSRLTNGTLFDGPTGGGTQKTQSYTFDTFGNLTNIAGTSGRTTPTSSATNRLNGAGTFYDAAGNLTNWNGAVYVYDHFNQMTDMTSGGEHAFYIYTVDDERVWSYDLVRNLSHWTLRDLGGKVLRDYVNNNGTWGLQSDYLYRDGLLLASETRTGQFHYHLDHLGTPRLITTISGTQAAYHAYYPFGEEATAYNQDNEPMKFTGHERDLASPNGPGDDLDYMHARFCSPLTGRFISPDPAETTRRTQAQSWNRYAYALNNPIRYVDPSGRTEREGWQAGVIVNNSSEVIWIAGDVGNKTYVIPLNPGESSTTYFVDADAIVIDSGEIGPEGASLAPSIEGEMSGAFKIGASVVHVEDSGSMDLGLNRSSGYAASWLVGRAGFLEAKQAKREGWVIPSDRKAAEKTKQELQKKKEEKKKQKQREAKDHA